MPMVLLLPPSEGKVPGGRGAWSPDSGMFGVALGPARAAVAAALASLGTSPAGLALTRVRGDRAVEEATVNASAVGAPVLPAGARFSGVVWDHLDAASLQGPARRRAASIVVPSPLGGLWAFGDPVPDHKLKMASRLPGIGSLTAHWRSLLPEALAGVAGRGPVVDLLPAEHRAALPLGDLRCRVVRIEFVTADGRGAAGHGAKAVKGIVGRHLLVEGGDPAAALDGFTWQGWRAVAASRSLVEVRAPG